MSRDARSDRTCARCARPLTVAQLRHNTARYCSRACRGLDQRRPDRPCGTCGMPFRPPRRSSRYCSVICVPRVTPPNWPMVHQPRRLMALLRLLDDTEGTWLTVSDMAIWLYGSDGWRAMKGVRNLIWRARRAGHRLSVRTVTWLPAGHGDLWAYRLVEKISEVAA